MVFRQAPGDRATGHGEVSYRLSRQSVVNQYRSGELSRSEACEVHPQLVRAAREVGTPTADDCPICDRDRLVHVTYVFGPRLPKHGRCITLRGELRRIAKRQGTFVAYVVECCNTCSWNHLVRRFVLADHSDD